MIKRMLIMLVIVGLLFGGVFGYQIFKAKMIKKYMASAQMPPATVTTTKARYQSWPPIIKSVGSLRAVHGTDVTTEISGLVRSVNFKSGDNVKEGQILLQLNADSDIAQLHALEAAAELARMVYDRDEKQFAVRAVSQATLDADAADLKGKQAQVAQQEALVAKKTIRAPFNGRLGITTINPGQYLNPGDKIVTLQCLDSIFVDFLVPQQELARLTVGQPFSLTTDAYVGSTYSGKITAINPQVDAATRNVQVEGAVDNAERELFPGMFGMVEVQAGEAKRYLTLPQTAVTYNPYGETVFLVESSGEGPDGKPALTVKQTFITVQETRGDQAAVIGGLKEGQEVVSSGQIKLRNGSRIIVNNQVQPANEAEPVLVDQ